MSLFTYLLVSICSTILVLQGIYSCTFNGDLSICLWNCELSCRGENWHLVICIQRSKSSNYTLSAIPCFFPPHILLTVGRGGPRNSEAQCKNQIHTRLFSLPLFKPRYLDCEPIATLVLTTHEQQSEGGKSFSLPFSNQYPSLKIFLLVAGWVRDVELKKVRSSSLGLIPIT